MTPQMGVYTKADTDADIAVHAALTTGIHGVGAGTLVGTTLSQTLTNKTLTSPTINGTIATTGLTMPAFTAGGDITIGANKIITTDLLLKQHDADQFSLRNAADTAFKSLRLLHLNFQGTLGAIADGTTIRASNIDGHHMKFEARDNATGVAEVARLQCAADPYFQATLPLRLLPIATASLPGTPVEGMIAYNDTLNKLVVYNGSAWETVTSV